MIPTVQLLTTNGAPSAIHKDGLDKFVLPITPNSSPMAAEQSLQQELQTTQHFNQYDDEQVLMHHEEVFSTCFDDIINGDHHSNDATSASFNENIQSDAADEHIYNDEMNYTIIENNLIVNTLDGNSGDDGDVEMDINKSGQHQSILMQIVDNIPMIFCNTITSTTPTSTVTTILSDLSPPQEPIEHDDRAVQQMPSESIENINCHDYERRSDDCADESTTMEPGTECLATSEETRQSVNGTNENCENIAIDYDDGDDDDDGSSSEHELTNLGWLIDLKNLTNWSADTTSTSRKHSIGTANSAATSGISTCIIDDIDDDDGCIEPIISDRDLSEERFKKFTIQVKQSQINYAERASIYKMDPLEKPPFNYAQIIAMAMMDQGRMTLKDICKWIQEHFAYFRYNKNWNNSIRHNLSLHFCFTKIARDKTEKGKGGYWELSMNTAKSEKKRIRNRRKQRDESGRFSNHHRHLSLRKSGQKQCNGKSKPNNATKTKNKSSAVCQLVANDSCNVSSASDASSSMCSANGNSEDTIANVWSETNEKQELNLLQHQQLQQHSHDSHAEHISQELIDDVIASGLVVINGTALNQSRTNSDIISCNFAKNSQMVDSYFVEQESNENATMPITSTTAAMLSDSSNEIYIKSDLPLCGDLSLIPFSPSSTKIRCLSVRLTGEQQQIHNNLDLFHTGDHQTNGDDCVSAASRSLSTIAANQQLNLISGIGGSGTPLTSSNVIVEPMPYCLSHMDTVIDIEHEFSSLVNMPDPELAEEGFFDYANW